VSFTGGLLPSEYPEAQALPNVRRFLAEQIDMQFADIRVLLRLPQPAIAPHVGANFTATAMILGQISGFSVWFFHNRSAKLIEAEERRRKVTMPLSGLRFTAFVRSYYPRAVGEPTPRTIGNVLYDTRNVLTHNLGVGEVRRLKGRRNVDIVKPDPALSEEDVVELENYASFSGARVPVQRRGQQVSLYVPGLYWALCRMLRAALLDQPARCETAVEPALGMFPSAAAR
jgi:hypothetical protein